MSLFLEKGDLSVTVRDDKDRQIIKGNGDNIAIARFLDMDDKTKNCVAEIYQTLTGKDIQEVMDFLNYKTNESEFCS